MKAKTFLVIKPMWGSTSGKLIGSKVMACYQNRPDNAPGGSLVVEVAIDIDPAWFTPQVTASLAAPPTVSMDPPDGEVFE